MDHKYSWSSSSALPSVVGQMLRIGFTHNGDFTFNVCCFSFLNYINQTSDFSFESLTCFFLWLTLKYLCAVRVLLRNSRIVNVLNSVRKSNMLNRKFFLPIKLTYVVLGAKTSLWYIEILKAKIICTLCNAGWCITVYYKSFYWMGYRMLENYP